MTDSAMLHNVLTKVKLEVIKYENGHIWIVGTCSVCHSNLNQLVPASMDVEQFFELFNEFAKWHTHEGKN